jgi:pyruvate dehydrogenase E1 component beta subunit
MRKITYIKAINEAVDEEMARDDSVMALGEDIGKHWGGPYGEFMGLFDKYGARRIKDTPISERAILGGAVGAAMTGLRPIAVIMFADFLGVCFDEVWNQLTKIRYMFGGKAKLPVTITSYSGAGVGGAAQHSKCMEGLLMSVPGLKIVSPATPYDAKGLLKSAIRDDNPVIYFIHKKVVFAGMPSEVPEEEYTVPLGQADIKKPGSDITVVAIGYMVHQALAAAAKLQEKGINAEVIDLRCSVPIDKNTIIGSIAKTGKLVIIDEEPLTGSVASEISAIVAQEAFEHLRAPVLRVCAPDTPIPMSPVLENFWMPDEGNLIEAVVSIM